MKKLALLVASFVSLNWGFGHPLSPLGFEGSFVNPSTTKTGCEEVFKVLKYQARHFLVGANMRTSVVNFKSDEPGAFFNGISLVGLLGPDNDIRVEKRLEKDGKLYFFVAEGYVSPDFLLLETKVEVKNPHTMQVLCRATADFDTYSRF